MRRSIWRMGRMCAAARIATGIRSRRSCGRRSTRADRAIQASQQAGAKAHRLDAPLQPLLYLAHRHAQFPRSIRFLAMCARQCLLPRRSNYLSQPMRGKRSLIQRSSFDSIQATTRKCGWWFFIFSRISRVANLKLIKEQPQILRLTTHELQDVRGPLRSE